MGVVELAELRVDLYRQGLGRQALGVLELSGGNRLGRGACAPERAMASA